MIKSTLGIYRHGVKLSNKTVHENPLPQFNVNIFCQHTFSDEVRQTTQYKKQSPTPRGKVITFSRKSKKRLSWVYNQYDWKSMLTLTYHKEFPDDGAISKKHLHNATLQIGRLGLKYLWVLEWQGRGFPHYHIWMSRELTKEEKSSIIEVWLNATKDYNNTDHCKWLHRSEQCYTDWDMKKGVDYAVKYAYKSEQKGLPLNVASYGRWYGHTRMKIQPDVEYLYSDAQEAEKLAMVSFNRNVHRCIRHWSRVKMDVVKGERKRKVLRKRKVKVDSKKGYTFVLSDVRREAIKRLFDYHYNLLSFVNIPEWVMNGEFG